MYSRIIHSYCYCRKPKLSCNGASTVQIKLVCSDWEDKPLTC